MRRYVTFAAVVLLLVAMLVIPAAASKPVAVEGSISGAILWDDAWTVGNRCFVVGEATLDFSDGDFDGTGQDYFWSVGHGPCLAEPAPLQMVETIRREGTFQGEVLGNQGTFVYRCQHVWRPDDPDTLMYDCNIRSGTGGLRGLHGHFDLLFLVGRFEGEVGFGGK